MTALLPRETSYEHLLTTAEAAEILRLSPRTLEDFRWRGAGPRYMKLSRNAVRYLHRDLLAWIEERARFNTSHPPLPGQEAQSDG